MGGALSTPEGGDDVAAPSERKVKAAEHPIRTALPLDHLATCALLREYEQDLGIDLCFQDFEAEIADPFAVYESIFLADDGCIALRRIDETTC